MRAVVQRVSEASVRVKAGGGAGFTPGEPRGAAGHIGAGLLVFLGVGIGDAQSDADYLVEKVLNLRIFPDDAGQMNRSVRDVGGGVLVVSQFTLYGDARKGRRPSYIDAAAPEDANRLYAYFVAKARESGLTVGEGVFRAMMDVALVNQGPVTILLDSRKQF